MGFLSFVQTCHRRVGLAFKRGEGSTQVCGLSRSSTLRYRKTLNNVTNYKVGSTTGPDLPVRMRAREVKVKTKSQAKAEEPKILKRTGMNTAMVLPKELQEFTGQDLMMRMDLISKICQYIKAQNLYAASGRHRFRCDETLRRILRTEGEHAVLQIHKFIAPQLIHPSIMGPDYEKRAEEMFNKYLMERGAIDRSTVPKQKDPRGKNSEKRQKELRELGQGMFREIPIAPCLKPLCDGKEKLSRPQAVKAVWNYIKTHDLQDENNRRRVIVDEGLRNGLQIFDKSSIDCFHVSRYVLRLCKNG